MGKKRYDDSYDFYDILVDQGVYNKCVNILYDIGTEAYYWDQDDIEIYDKYLDGLKHLTNLKKFFYVTIKYELITILAIAHLLFIYTVKALYKEEKHVHLPN